MALKIVGKCSNCGADVKLNEDQEKGYCQYCGTEYIVDEGKRGFADKAFSYLNKAGKRRQEEIRLKEEAKERAAIRAAEERKQAEKSMRNMLFIAVGLLCIVGIFELLKEGKNPDNIVEEVGHEVTSEVGVEKASEKDSVIPKELELTEKPSRQGFDTAKNVKEIIGLYIFDVPNYLDADIAENDIYRAYAEKGEKTVMLQCVAEEDSEPVDISWFKNVDNENAYVGSLTGALEDASYERGELKKIGNIEGYFVKYNFAVESVNGVAWNFIFPSTDDNKWITITMMQSDQSDYDYYDDYLKIVKSFAYSGNEETKASEEPTLINSDVMEKTLEIPFEVNAKYSMLQNFYIYMEDPNVTSLDELVAQAKGCGLKASYKFPSSDETYDYDASVDLVIRDLDGGKIESEFTKQPKNVTEGIKINGKTNVYSLHRHTFRIAGSNYVAEYYPSNSSLMTDYRVKDDAHPLGDVLNCNSITEALDKLLEIVN